MKAKTAIVTVFALVLAAAVVCGEQYRLGVESAVNNDAAATQTKIAASKVDVTN